jgi:thiamine monophosphate kinase
MRLEKVIAFYRIGKGRSLLRGEGENGDRRIVTGKIGDEPFGTLTLPLEQGAKSPSTVHLFRKISLFFV